jgi:hypothetical protein
MISPEMRRLSVMQPYIFPYIGYFQLINATDMIIFYDDVTYIKGGWINRNRLVFSGNDNYFSIPLLNSSSYRLIKDIELHPTQYFVWKKKFFKSVQQNYSKAPYFKDIFNLIAECFDDEYGSISDLAINSVNLVFSYLDKKIEWAKSSEITPHTKGFERADRIIQIAKELDCTVYINMIGGKGLYSKSYFKERGVDLRYIQPENITYRQFHNEFIPWLSILDILMFNDKKTVLNFFESFKME